MRKLALFLFLFLGILSMYSQYTPFKLERKSNLDVYQNAVTQQNSRGDWVMESVLNSIQSGVTALEEREFSKAKTFFESALDLINRGNYQSRVGSDIMKKLRELRDYADYRISNPNLNPFYKMWIGSITKIYDSIDVYAYGIGDSLSFIIFESGLNEAIMIPENKIEEFAQLMEDFYQAGQVLNTPSKKKQKLHKSFPLYFNGYYADKKKNMPMIKRVFICDLEYNYLSKSYMATICADSPDNIALILQANELKNLPNFISVLRDSKKMFCGTKKKVADDDSFLSYLSDAILKDIIK